jgi:hypothetical protein
MDTNVDEISQHSVDLVVTLLTIFLYISFLSLMHFLIKWEEISRFHIGWTNMIIEIKERNQTTKYEIEELMKMLNAVPMINHRQAIQMNTEPLAIETESPNAPDLSSNEESESNNEPSPSPSPSPTPPVTRSRYNR